MMMHSFSLVLYHDNRIVNDIRLHANANYNVRCAAAEKSKFIWKDQKTVAVGITPSLLQTILMGSGMFEKTLCIVMGRASEFRAQVKPKQEV